MKDEGASSGPTNGTITQQFGFYNALLSNRKGVFEIVFLAEAYVTPTRRHRIPVADDVPHLAFTVWSRGHVFCHAATLGILISQGRRVFRPKSEVLFKSGRRRTEA